MENINEKIEKIIRYQMAVERNFARILCEKPKLDVIYSKDAETSCTNGELIMLTPEANDFYCNKPMLMSCCRALDISPSFAEPEIAIKVLTHGFCIHECLHILYTDFAKISYIIFNLKSQAEKEMFHHISNILEDAYIEKRGCSQYENIGFYLTFLRYCISYSTYTTYEECDENDLVTLITYIFDRYLSFCHPKIEISDTLRPYIDAVTELADKAIAEDEAEERLLYSLKILEAIRPLFNSCADNSRAMNALEMLRNLMKAASSSENIENEHNKSAGKNSSGASGASADGSSEAAGKTNSTSADGSSEKDASSIFDTEKANIRKEANSFLKANSENEGQSNSELYDDCNSSFLSPNIPPDYRGDHSVSISPCEETLQSRLKYDEALRKNRSVINKMTKKIGEWIFNDSWEPEPNKTFGFRINTRRLGDVKKRYWYGRRAVKNAADLSAAIIIDCSGSMSGHESQIKDAALILRESLLANEIPFCIAFHNFDWKTEIYPVADFKALKSDKSAIYSVETQGSSCESDALEWAYKNLLRNADTSSKLIISISDGEPDDILSAQELVKKISRHGISVAAIAVNNAYNSLSRMYPHCIECNKTEELPEKLTKIIQKAIGGCR